MCGWYLNLCRLVAITYMLERGKEGKGVVERGKCSTFFFNRPNPCRAQVMVFALGSVSGAHFNPAVSLAITLRGRRCTVDITIKAKLTLWLSNKCFFKIVTNFCEISERCSFLTYQTPLIYERLTHNLLSLVTMRDLF